ncbi:hypothetical protein LF887_01775 [Chryseobacterium sp. MEBOG06]|uniref:hypothetical protein n=1 Tax=unclassified Chryseobacterium TaxID=2593645 RepID=UPI001F2C85C4|nr:MULTISPECIES: hypothetical protein [unclassified Chryseobacterium]UKB84404.1 hypothetical protein LF887_01775 [Chryseobacterium sp. MEBOG06]
MKSISPVEKSNTPHKQMQRPTAPHSNVGTELLYKKLQESLARTGNINHPETREIEKSFMMTLNIDQTRTYLDQKSGRYTSQAITDDSWPYPIYIRAFAPFKTFGMGFDGDGENRGYTTSLSATSRLSQSYIMDPSTHKYTNLVTKSDPSHHPIFGTKTASDDKGSVSDFIYKVNKDGSNTISWTSTMAGHNPLIPLSPNINVKTKFSLTENTKTGTLDIMAQQFGDRFPAAETFIQDTKGNALFIGVSPYDGNPYTSLPGEDNDRSMMTANFSVNIDKNGVFTGIKMGKTIFSIQEWNTMMQSTPLDADDKDKSEKGGSFGGRGAGRRW